MKTFIYFGHPDYVINANSYDEAFDILYDSEFKNLKLGFTKEQYKKSKKLVEIDTEKQGIVYRSNNYEVHEGF